MAEITLISTPPQLPTEASQSDQNPPPPQPHAGTQNRILYKNMLQQYVQKLSLPLPVYQTRNEGSSHAPMFRATVWVEDICCTTPNVFSNKKPAEQEVARIALDALMQKVKDDGLPYIHENTIYCKTILNEFAIKMHLDLPTYQTSQQQQDKVPAFTTTLVFNGASFTGPVARNKKEAEQLAARVAILSIMGTPGPNSALISKIVKSKYPSGLNKGNASNKEGSLLNKENENIHGEVTSDMATTSVDANHMGKVVGVPELKQPFHEFKKPELATEHTPAVPSVPAIVFVPAGHEQPQDADLGFGKKQRKRAKKNPIPNAQLPTPGVSPDQVSHSIPQ